MLWDVRSQRVLQTLSPNRPAPAIHATFSPDSTRVISGDFVGVIHIWDAASGREIIKVTPHTSDVQALRVSPDGKRLATLGDDGLLQTLTLDIDLLLDTARKRLQRTRFQFPPEECERYFQSTTCPPLP